MLTCKQPYQVRDCASCARNPSNQTGKGAGQPITPKPRNGCCPAYTMVLRESDKAGRA